MHRCLLEVEAFVILFLFPFCSAKSEGCNMPCLCMVWIERRLSGGFRVKATFSFMCMYHFNLERLARATSCVLVTVYEAHKPVVGGPVATPISCICRVCALFAGMLLFMLGSCRKWCQTLLCDR